MTASSIVNAVCLINKCRFRSIHILNYRSHVKNIFWLFTRNIILKKKFYLLKYISFLSQVTAI